MVSKSTSGESSGTTPKHKGAPFTQTISGEAARNELARNELALNEPTLNKLTSDAPRDEVAFSQGAMINGPRLRRERTDGVTILSFYHLAWGGLYLLGALALALPTLIAGVIGFAENSDMFWITGILGIATFFTFGLSLMYCLVGVGLWQLRQWARVAAMALGFISLPTGLGTIPGALTLWYLLKEEISSLFR